MAQPAGDRILGRQPVGILLSAPYAVFIAAVFAYPLGLAVWISFRDYVFTAPGVSVPRPFVGLDNYAEVLADPAVRRSFLNILIFLVINVPLTVALSLLLATALNAAIPFRTFFRASFYVPYVTASVAVVGVWLFLFSSDGLVNQTLGSAGARPVMARQRHLGDAVDRASSSPGSSSASSSCCTSPRCRTCRRSSTSRRRSTGPRAGAASGRSPCPACGRRRRW